MTFLDRLTGLFRKGGDVGGGKSGGKSGDKSDLQANMEKALHMKREAGSQAKIPEHRTANEGAVQGRQMSMTDRDAGSEGSHQPQLKRSHVARSGDA